MNISIRILGAEVIGITTEHDDVTPEHDDVTPEPRPVGFVQTGSHHYAEESE